MILNGLQDLLPFLKLLSDHKIAFRIEQFRSDTIMVTISLVGARIEVDFFDDHIEYSVFEGREAALDDQTKLFARLARDFA